MKDASLTPTVPTDFDWESLRSAEDVEWDNGSVARRVLDEWRRKSGASSAAVYAAAGEGRWQRRVTSGAGTLPESIVEMPEGVGVRELPGGLVVLYEGTSASALGQHNASEYLMTAGVRLQQLSDQLKAQSFQKSLDSVKMEALYDVGLSITSTLEMEELADSILMHAVSLLDARRGAIYLVEGGQYVLQRSILGQAPKTLSLDDELITKLLQANGSLPAEDIPDMHHLMAVAVEVEGDPRGLLLVGDKESRTGVGPFTDADYRSLSLFAAQAAIALENARLHRQALEKERLEREMELAAEIQRGILPVELAQVAGWELVGWNRPSRQVGGDYFGSFPLPDGSLGVVVADVTGKGVPAALLVSTLHSALKLMLDRNGASAELLARLNQHICEASSSNKFITLILARLAPDSDEVEYMNAGHNPGVVMRSNGEVALLGPSGVPLGLLRGSQYTTQTTKLGDGDLLCLYSDGITECEAPDDEQFELDRFTELLAAHRSEPLNGILSATDRAVREFAAGRSQNDDQTVVLARRTGA